MASSQHDSCEWRRPEEMNDGSTILHFNACNYDNQLRCSRLITHNYKMIRARSLADMRQASSMRILLTASSAGYSGASCPQTTRAN